MIIFTAKGIPLHSYSKTQMATIKPISDKGTDGHGAEVFCLANEKRLGASFPILGDSETKLGSVVVSESLDDVFSDFRNLDGAAIALMQANDDLFFATEPIALKAFNFSEAKTTSSHDHPRLLFSRAATR